MPSLANKRGQGTHDESIPQNVGNAAGRRDDRADPAAAGAETTKGIQEVAGGQLAAGNWQAGGGKAARDSALQLWPAGPSPLHYLSRGGYLVRRADLRPVEW